jgi:tripartite-type tricarboxylate transporter receptor subunit TctC
MKMFRVARRVNLLKGSALAIGLPFCRRASAQALSYPTKPVKVVVPFPPGGATDLVARSVFDALSKQFGQAFIIENKAGAGGSLGTSELVRANPDGYTLGIATTSTHAVNPTLNPATKYDPIRDFTPVAQIVSAPGVLVVSPSVPVESLSELVAFVRKNPGKLTYASAGVGSIGHLWGEMLKSATKMFILHIPYRGASQAQTDLLSGIVQIGFDQVASALPMIKAGKVKAIAVGSAGRLSTMPTVPTFHESGYSNLSLSSWFGVVGPAKMPVEIAEKLNKAINSLLTNSEFVQKLVAQGLYPVAGSTSNFSRLIVDEIARVKAIAKSANITLDS